MIEVPVGFQIGGIVVATAGTIFGIFKAGVDKGAKKNGYVEKKECQVSVNRITAKMDKGFTEVHEKINETNAGVAYIKGVLDK